MMASISYWKILGFVVLSWLPFLCLGEEVLGGKEEVLYGKASPFIEGKKELFKAQSFKTTSWEGAVPLVRPDISRKWKKKSALAHQTFEVPVFQFQYEKKGLPSFQWPHEEAIQLPSYSHHERKTRYAGKKFRAPSRFPSKAKSPIWPRAIPIAQELSTSNETFSSLKKLPHRELSIEEVRRLLNEYSVGPSKR